MKKTDRITIQGIEIPVPEAGTLQDFVSPNWIEVVAFYPKFCKLILANENERIEPYDPQPYLLEFANELHRHKVREGRNRDMWMQRMMEHWGVEWVGLALQKMNAIKQAAMEDEDDG